MKRSIAKNSIKSFVRFVIGSSCILFTVKAFEVVPSTPNAVMFIKTIFLTKTGSNVSQTGISLEGNGGHAWFQGNVTLASLTGISVLGTDSNGKIIASAGVAGGDSLWTQAGGHIYNNNHATGNVGIGITSPTQALQVSGNILGGAPNNSMIAKYSSLVGGMYNTLKGTVGFIGGGVANTIVDLGSTEIDPSGSDMDLSYLELNSSGFVVLSGFNTIVGGFYNILTGMGGFIGGGGMNAIYGTGSNIVGGLVNYIEGMTSNIVGGMQNEINTGDYSSILGGRQNSVGDTISGSASYTSIVGGQNNSILDDYGFIGGGMNNSTKGVFSSLVGGKDNLLGSIYGFIGGGLNNNVGGPFSAIMGGSGNTTTKGSYNFIGGGNENSIGLGYSSIVGGFKNYTNGFYLFIGGGSGNRVDADYGSIVGGVSNTIQQNATYGFIGGGNENNIQQSKYGFVGGGDGNNVKSDYSTIVGGKKNVINSTGSYGFIGGGIGNYLGGSEVNSSILGGSGNGMNNGFGRSNSILGGEANRISSKTTSQYSVVAGGFNNKIIGETVVASFAAGYKSRVANTNTFVWNSSTGSFESDQDYTFLINAPYSGGIENIGGVGINLNAPTAALDVSGSIKTNEYLIVNSGGVDYTGINKTIDIQLSGGTSTCTLIFVKGLLTSTSCP